MNKRVQTAAIGAGRTDGSPDPVATTGGNQVVTYGPATGVVSPVQITTRGVAVSSSRTVVTRAANGPLTLRYTPRKTTAERLPTS
jgi:hypothetical protein